MTDTIPPDEEAVVRGILAALGEAWNQADGSRFADAFTADADFVNILGGAFRGRDAIAAQHQQIFDTIYKGSHAVFELVASRRLAQSVIVAHVAATLDAPQGPRLGTTKTLATSVLVEQDGDWRIAAFHNTVIGSPPGAAPPGLA